MYEAKFYGKKFQIYSQNQGSGGKIEGVLGTQSIKYKKVDYRRENAQLKISLGLKNQRHHRKMVKRGLLSNYRSYKPHKCSNIEESHCKNSSRKKSYFLDFKMSSRNERKSISKATHNQRNLTTRQPITLKKSVKNCQSLIHPESIQLFSQKSPKKQPKNNIKYSSLIKNDPKHDILQSNRTNSSIKGPIILKKKGNWFENDKNRGNKLGSKTIRRFNERSGRVNLSSQGSFKERNSTSATLRSKKLLNSSNSSKKRERCKLIDSYFSLTTPNKNDKESILSQLGMVDDQSTSHIARQLNKDARKDKIAFMNMRHLYVQRLFRSQYSKEDSKINQKVLRKALMPKGSRTIFEEKAARFLTDTRQEESMTNFDLWSKNQQKIALQKLGLDNIKVNLINFANKGSHLIRKESKELLAQIKIKSQQREQELKRCTIDSKVFDRLSKKLTNFVKRRKAKIKDVRRTQNKQICKVSFKQSYNQISALINE